MTNLNYTNQVDHGIGKTWWSVPWGPVKIRTVIFGTVIFWTVKIWTDTIQTVKIGSIVHVFICPGIDHFTWVPTSPHTTLLGSTIPSQRSLLRNKDKSGFGWRKTGWLLIHPTRPHPTWCHPTPPYLMPPDPTPPYLIKPGTALALRCCCCRPLAPEAPPRKSRNCDPKLFVLFRKNTPVSVILYIPTHF